MAVNAENVGVGLIVGLMTIELLTCWTAYQVLVGKKWALITLTIYYGLRSLNIYTDAFSFYSKSGLNIEISLGQTIGINVLTLVFFILLVRELNRVDNVPAANNVHVP
jgi:hypothetical protein